MLIKTIATKLMLPICARNSEKTSGRGYFTSSATLMTSKSAASVCSGNGFVGILLIRNFVSLLLHLAMSSIPFSVTCIERIVRSHTFVERIEILMVYEENCCWYESQKVPATMDIHVELLSCEVDGD